ncbi:16S rRNA (cytosine1402-N4)-methyltransferase [Motilibacter peucedani]|uniref:Ribosomal RNA small subunit methyltransferase H n=1 Tax=Motilibacter peucedani TaxID=598650 RepID=A0A420XPJ8_9ACTN|nr:16S rRNA (cytosine(1402)-N(4))-methyltransferase RsmH [Motilibacter peucedani]RKS74105.1 16S rRNA (cytosine1402-N4)-methyltransferase [Motilibacter peucedani]
MEERDWSHVPVLLRRCLSLLAPAVESVPEPVVVDATLGLGGHTAALLEAHPALRVVGLDRDPEALERSGARLAGYGERVTAVHAVYDEVADVLDRLGIERVQGVLFDLGVSSLQLDAARRGFAYAQDAPLDMRMDPTTGITAADVVNTYAPGELVRILRDFGEERFARRIVDAIVRQRAVAPFSSTAPLAELVRTAVPAATRRTGGHPAKRAFQALRIEVNGELAALEAALPAAIGSLALGGRLVVLSYHSLEDRMVKRAITARTTVDLPPGLPVVPEGMQPELRSLTRGGAELATDEEVAANPRAASVRLRAAERIREAA